jgi:cbb3-type cytochrome oxidase maturation protein
MEILLLLVPVSVLLVFVIGAVFWWSVRSGQFDDLDGPAHRILADDDTSDVIPPVAPGGDAPSVPHRALTSVNPGSNEHR